VDQNFANQHLEVQPLQMESIKYAQKEHTVTGDFLTARLVNQDFFVQQAK